MSTAIRITTITKPTSQRQRCWRDRPDGRAVERLGRVPAANPQDWQTSRPAIERSARKRRLPQFWQTLVATTAVTATRPACPLASILPSVAVEGRKVPSHGLAGKATSSAIGSGHVCFKGIHQKSVLTCFDVIEDILKNIVAAYTYSLCIYWWLY